MPTLIGMNMDGFSRLLTSLTPDLTKAFPRCPFSLDPGETHAFGETHAYSVLDSVLISFTKNSPVRTSSSPAAQTCLEEKCLLNISALTVK
jgi:hypothetical protein